MSGGDVSTVGRQVDSPAGEKILVPLKLGDAIRATCRTVQDIDATSFDTWLFAFTDALALELHRLELTVVPRGFAKSSETVHMNTYTLALAGKHHAERTVHACRDVFRGDACRADLHGAFSAMVDALTGHAPPLLEGAAGLAIAAIDERLRALRLLLLGVPVDQPAADAPRPAAEEGAA